jgi:serine protease Do
MNSIHGDLSMYRSSLELGKGLARRGSGIVLTVVLLLIVGMAGFHLGEGGASADSGPVAVPATPGIASAAQLGQAFGEVARRVEPAVVNINTEQVIRTSGTPLEEFFGLRGMPREFRRPSLGSGFIADPQGYILTNDHVVRRADRISVKLNDGRTLDATVVGTDPQTDIAVIKIRETNLPYLRLADSNKAGVGDWVLAFGSPFGLEKTMTAGIISAKGRVIGAGQYDDFLQTDAAINPGNSGGPLVNLQGEVVGINTMIASQNGGWQGVGFAIPSSMAAGVYRQLADSGKVTRGWMGVSLDEITPETARRLGLSDTRGALVTQVEPRSPAGRAGLRPGDVIVGSNGQEILSPHNLKLAVADSRPDMPLRLSVLRNGSKLAVDLRLGERPAQLAER